MRPTRLGVCFDVERIGEAAGEWAARRPAGRSFPARRSSSDMKATRARSPP